MSEKSLGEVLRESRVGKNITLDDIESKTGISSHYLLAMELDQFKIIPEEKFDQYLKDYADIVELDFITLKRRYHYQVNAKKKSDTKSVTEIVEEKLSQKRLREKMATGGMPYPHYTSTPPKKTQETLVIPVKTVGLDSKTLVKAAIPAASQFKNDDRLVPKKANVSRSRRYDNGDRSKKSIVPAFVLGLVALAIIGVIFFGVWKQFEKGQRAKEAEMTLLEASKKSKAASKESSSEPQTQITTEGADNYLVATVTKSKETVDITVSLTDAESSWISLTNSEIGESGTTLTQESPTYTTTLPADVTESLLTLGITKGVSVTVDGQPLDLSALTSTDLSYITFKIQ
ncbi:helix-turn-helix domain-containing protein [Streptococcus dysgalactiae]|uniref:helix-turn-helix domain-containing protein n=1 Tax=Streptococcus dysgalactiae TaxID=1334 RepID=UPI001CF3653B|nr:helix-turn-helix domain-containing protein [Streptococcus dysgalactiae]MCB2833203.1 helix-turn-helix domain-containing protein [Streptococcus dysgalactiae subsp. dysgalactiae]MCB2840909.1 helix-turn-helix domain-containing protein [Streptococcus dysgalactiae subsp. dysgalactiae]MCB2844730.1 helix-turn-helix domain-containing protein [Streptococcus dysgalactiae subsp. dysgalactiae]